MLKALKYIVVVFGSLGILVGGFFAYQNRNDLSAAFEYNSILDYDHLKETCLNIEKDYYFPCLKEKFSDFLSRVSLTGTNIGMKMVFTVMDEDKLLTKKFETEKQKQVEYTINYLEINNMAISNAYKKYFGFENMYGGFISSLDRYYTKAFVFSENLILGLDSHEGIKSIPEPLAKAEADQRFQRVKDNYYQHKQIIQTFLETEIKKITQ